MLVKNSQKNTPPTAIKYRPLMLGAPSKSQRTGFVVRNTAGSSAPVLTALAPLTHTGLTCLTQPTFYWYTSQPLPTYFQFAEFVLRSDESIALRTKLPLFAKKGLQHLNLADYNIALKQGVEYSWSIVLVKNPKARSEDYVSDGKVKYIKPDKAFQHAIINTLATKKASAYAESGFWYEALATAADQFENQPNDLNSLLQQVEIDIF